MQAYSQCSQILKTLKAGEMLTGMDILKRFQCMNYKGRISDLRKYGNPILTEMIKIASGKTIAHYSYIFPDDQDKQIIEESGQIKLL